MSGPAELLDLVGAELGEPVLAAEPVGGGSINDAWRLELGDGERVFLKHRAGAPAAEFAAEAAGLTWLAEAEALSLPRVLGCGRRPAWLALEWVEPDRREGLDGERLGTGLALLHRAGASAHGELPPSSPDALLRIGSVELPAGATGSWAELYAESRLQPLLRMAREREALGERDAVAIDAVCGRIEELAGPAEPPARLHGDLWGGNVLAGPGGEPWLIDPAAHGGHREIDLAMLRLFGGPGERTFAAYAECHPLAPGHQERVALWQLLPLLVHAVLFGGSYGSAAGRAARSLL